MAAKHIRHIILPGPEREHMNFERIAIMPDQPVRHVKRHRVRTEPMGKITDPYFS